MSTQNCTLFGIFLILDWQSSDKDLVEDLMKDCEPSNMNILDIEFRNHYNVSR